MQTVALLAALCTTPGLVVAGTQPTPIAAAEEVGQPVLVKIKIKRGDKTLKHPGHRMETGEEIVLVLTEGKKSHEVTLYVEAAESGFKIEASYTASGKKVLEGKSSAKAKAWTEFKSADGKTVVSVHLDPNAKRPDKVELPGSRDPLDGV